MSYGIKFVFLLVAIAIIFRWFVMEHSSSMVLLLLFISMWKFNIEILSIFAVCNSLSSSLFRPSKNACELTVERCYPVINLLAINKIVRLFWSACHKISPFIATVEEIKFWILWLNMKMERYMFAFKLGLIRCGAEMKSSPTIIRFKSDSVKCVYYTNTHTRFLTHLYMLH